MGFSKSMDVPNKEYLDDFKLKICMNVEQGVI